MQATYAGFRSVTAPAFQVIRASFHRAQHGRATLIAAGCAFYATLALFPGLSTLLSVYGLAFKPSAVVDQMLILRDVLPPEAYLLIARRAHVLVQHAPRQLAWSVWIGTAIALWSASTGTKALLAAIDMLYGGARRSMLRFQAVGLTMTLCAVLAAILAVSLLIALPEVLHMLGWSARARGTIHSVSLGVLVLFVGGAISALYRFGPTPRAGHKCRVWPGAMVWAAPR